MQITFDYPEQKQTSKRQSQISGRYSNSILTATQYRMLANKANLRRFGRTLWRRQLTGLTSVCLWTGQNYTGRNFEDKAKILHSTKAVIA